MPGRSRRPVGDPIVVVVVDVEVVEVLVVEVLVVSVLAVLVREVEAGVDPTGEAFVDDEQAEAARRDAATRARRLRSTEQTYKVHERWGTSTRRARQSLPRCSI
jgi:hypothetical protein